ncbi:MAG: NfeD family protein [Bilophila sp.]
MSASVIWFVIGVVFFLTELFSPLFVMMFFALGAWAAGVTTALTGSLALALTSFCVVSVGSLLLLRKVLVRTFKGRSRMAAVPDETESTLTGQLATVTRPITPQNVGEITVGGSFWRAIGTVAIAEGTTVRILGSTLQDALLLRVTPHDGLPPSA